MIKKCKNLQSAEAIIWNQYEGVCEEDFHNILYITHTDTDTEFKEAYIHPLYYWDTYTVKKKKKTWKMIKFNDSSVSFELRYKLLNP